MNYALTSDHSTGPCVYSAKLFKVMSRPSILALLL